MWAGKIAQSESVLIYLMTSIPEINMFKRENRLPQLSFDLYLHTMANVCAHTHTHTYTNTNTDRNTHTEREERESDRQESLYITLYFSLLCPLICEIQAPSSTLFHFILVCCLLASFILFCCCSIVNYSICVQNNQLYLFWKTGYMTLTKLNIVSSYNLDMHSLLFSQVSWKFMYVQMLAYECLQQLYSELLELVSNADVLQEVNGYKEN